MSDTQDDTSEKGVPNTQSKTPDAGDSLASAAAKSAGKSLWMGTAAGIGSAAIVAALLYTRSNRKKP